MVSSWMREICSAARCTGDDPMKYAPVRSRAAFPLIHDHRASAGEEGSK